jgi:esterase/lipase
MDGEISFQSIKIKNKHGDNLVTDIRFPAGKKNIPLVIFCHGFKGFKDWGGFPYVMDKLAQNGCCAVSFNFSYNGTGEDGDDLMQFTRLDRFAKNTFSRELDDLGSVIDYIFDHCDDIAEGNIDCSSLILIGHSRGGGIAILKAAEDKRVKKLITLASVSKFDRHSEGFKKRWKEKGYYEVMNTRTKQMMRMDYDLIEDLEKNINRLDIKKAMSKIDIPVLTIHGKEDLSVDYSDAEILFISGNKEKIKLVLMENTGHTFGVVHPFQGTTRALEKVIELVVKFVKSEKGE